MQSQPTDPMELRGANRQFMSPPREGDAISHLQKPTKFHSQFVDSMEMNTDARAVAEYLDAHHEWFRRCAHPMQVDSIGKNSYALIIGHFGAFGYEVEPKIGLDLLPQDEGIYRIETIAIPGYASVGYDVDFRAALNLVERESAQADIALTTHVEWLLDLTVNIQFPRFIQALPEHLIQKTGDRLLRQVVRQVSRRLTYKVQEDFHTSRNLPMPKRARKWL